MFFAPVGTQVGPTGAVLSLQPRFHKRPHLLLQVLRCGGVEDFDLVGDGEVEPADGVEAVDGCS